MNDELLLTLEQKISDFEKSFNQGAIGGVFALREKNIVSYDMYLKFVEMTLKVMHEDKAQAPSIVNQHLVNTDFLIAARKNDYTQALYYLTQAPIKADPTTGHHYVVRTLPMWGYVECFDLVLTHPALKEHANIHFQEDEAFKKALDYNKPNMIMYCINYIYQHEKNYLPIYQALCIEHKQPYYAHIIDNLFLKDKLEINLKPHDYLLHKTKI